MSAMVPVCVTDTHGWFCDLMVHRGKINCRPNCILILHLNCHEYYNGMIRYYQLTIKLTKGNLLTLEIGI